MDAITIRQKFLDFFARHGHQVVKSSSIVPANDPTLYFTNAGMVQFKDVFVGKETRSYSRACSSQKCLRVSGKHNDLENVGQTARHHTFFEMLGNFSFGDYFKREAIRLGWDFLVKELELDPDRMVVTVFAGEEGIPADDEAFDLWQKEAGLPADRIFKLGASENFWSMGNVGPCGPCSEIHYFQGDHIPCPEQECKGVACECDRWLEIWNLVFMQFDRNEQGEYTPLKATGVDTGMGLERLAAVKQHKESNYDTDLLRPLIDFIAQLAGKTYGADPGDDMSMRVIADHARATAFCISDGVFPEKGNREYVLRRIMRRAIRHGKLLGFEEPFFHQVCLQVVELMGDFFPELVQRRQVIETITQAEETSFRRTLNRGLNKLQEEIKRAQGLKQTSLSTPFVGDLYATDGFPIDLTRLIAEESDLSVDEEGARKWVQETHGATDTRVGNEAVATIYKELTEQHGQTKFLGYTEEEEQGTVLALIRDGAPVKEVHPGEVVELVTDQTPFYGKAGGQLGDSGRIEWEGGAIEVRSTLKPGGQLIIHQGKVTEGALKAGATVSMKVNIERRQLIRLNHSATHLLHHALREILGAHVAQKGSEVGPRALRFDFSHFEQMSPELIRQVEQHVNREIRANGATRTEIKPIAEAQKMGAMALFGEKYGEEVRVVNIGRHSVELCGGTHVKQSGEIGLFKIASEEALAMGVRRIVGLTGAAALEQIQSTEQHLRAAANQLRCGPDQVESRAEKLIAQGKEQERSLETLKRRLATGGGEDLLARVKEVKGIKVLATRVEAADPKILRQAGDTLRDRLGSGVIILGGEHGEKGNLLVIVTKDLTDRYHAGKMVAQLAKILEGRGGGRPDMAQAGGPRLDKLDEAIQASFDLI